MTLNMTLEPRDIPGPVVAALERRRWKWIEGKGWMLYSANGELFSGVPQKHEKAFMTDYARAAVTYYAQRHSQH